MNMATVHHIPHWGVNLYITKVLKVIYNTADYDVFRSVEAASRRC